MGGGFKEFLDRKSTRLVLAGVCAFMACRGVMRIWASQTKADLFLGGGELLLWFSWTLINFLKASDRQAPRLGIFVNVGIVMMVIGLVMGA